MVTFYRGVWCPYCNMDLQALREVLPAIVERGAQLVAISPQTQSNSRKSQRENKVTFPILSDPGNEVAARFDRPIGAELQRRPVSARPDQVAMESEHRGGEGPRHGGG